LQREKDDPTVKQRKPGYGLYNSLACVCARSYCNKQEDKMEDKIDQAHNPN